ncbi:GMC family oxidoreductase [Nocardia sp. NBC_00881]|uniref:GMC family oxidoreductase n=1 Tax=Nocardia sp. NBC_00881 TaxID=2975995 RepID=UPI00386CAD56|nr:GMC family oxidoreductase [Nocardia sp. NBC_00881]
MSNPEHFDLVIVGGGIAAATIAKTVIEQAAAQNPPRHPHILILEAGRATAMSADKYDTYVQAYQQALYKVPNSPYPATSSAPQPDVLDIDRPPSSRGYFVQKGPMPFGSDYARTLGGTTLHWLGTCLRMLPTDFKMHTTYDRGVDWPLTYEDLKPYYERAEWDIIGVAGDVDDQNYPGIEPTNYFQTEDRNRFGHRDYYFPMQPIPSSYLDNYIKGKIDNKTVTLSGDSPDIPSPIPDPPPTPLDSCEFTLTVSNTPVARNSTPTTDSYQVVGAVGNADQGQRCEGNSSCIPICPAQAKYSALKTLYELIINYPDSTSANQASKARVTVRSQCVVTRVLHTPEFLAGPRGRGVDHGDRGPTGVVTGVTYMTYFDDGRPPLEHTVTADIYVLAANAIENATLLLASDNAANRSDQVGRNLMDHPLLLTWGLLEDNVGAFRGPGSTSGIPSFRDGDFRSDRTAFRVEIGNWGWNFPENAPYDTVHDLVDIGEKDKGPLYGKDLRTRLGDVLPRQFRIAWELEQDPEQRNRVTIEDRYKDALGKHRPVIEYDLSDYVRKSLPWAAEASRQLFEYLGIAEHQERPTYKPGDYTHYDDSDASAVTVGTETYWVRGAGHVVGTHRMGDNPTDSVVDSFQRSHDLPNLYIVGCGSMPTLGTSNPTLTMTALAIRTGDQIAEDLGQQKGSHE